MNLISFAFLTRICIITIQSVANGIIPDHAATDVFVSPQQRLSSGSGWFGWTVESLLGGLARWDAQYFLHIATHGYSYEQTLAFYPLFPLIVGFFAKIVHILLPILSIYHYCLITATLLNVLFFVKAVECLHELSFRLTGNKKWAQLVAILFCVNPASIFFTASYSEALFAWLSFRVMLETSDGSPSVARTAIPLSLSLITRSNGFINIGFVAYGALKVCCSPSKKVSSKASVVLRSAMTVFLSLSLYVVMHLYFYLLFCSEGLAEHSLEIAAYAEVKGLRLMGGSNSTPPWCSYDIPVSYSYVQSEYWDVGFLRYYEWKQIPNFLLAAPILALVLHFCFTYIRTHTRYCLHLGLFENKATKKITLFERQIFPFIAHGLFLSLFCVFFVHIQVSTRLLASSSPLLYWLCANYFKDATINGFEDIRDIILLDKSEARRLILCYFVGYACIGTILFSNFLPWT